MTSTRWEIEYERTSQECIDAASTVALEPSPRIWPISGDGVADWNPGGHPISLKVPPERWVDTELHDERTPPIPTNSSLT